MEGKGICVDSTLVFEGIEVANPEDPDNESKNLTTSLVFSHDRYGRPVCRVEDPHTLDVYTGIFTTGDASDADGICWYIEWDDEGDGSFIDVVEGNFDRADNLQVREWHESLPF